MKNNAKYLLKNIGLLTLSNFGSKILVFLLVPLYTRLLTTEEYGIYDIYLTTITLLIPILSLNIVEAVMRFTLDKKIEKSSVFTIGLKIAIRSIMYCMILVVINYLTNFISIFNQYPQYFLLYYSLNILYDLVTQFVKSMEKILDFAIASILNSLTMLLLNILFLAIFKMDLRGYFLANCIAFLLPIAYLVVRLRLWRYIRKKSEDKKLKNEMIKYSSPLIMNTIGWWITNASDRYILTAMKGLSENGIYSVSYKIPSILNVIQAIFSQAWIMSAVKAYDEEEAEFINKTYTIYNALFVIMCSVIIIFVKMITRILVSSDFYEAWKYGPFLMISVLFTSLSNFLGGIFAASKQSSMLGKTTIMGAIINIVLNVILIKNIGTMGAAIATMISYFFVWLFRLMYGKKIANLNISIGRDLIGYFILLIQAIIINTLKINTYLYMIEAVLCITIISVYRQEIMNIIKIAKNQLALRKGKNKIY